MYKRKTYPLPRWRRWGFDFCPGPEGGASLETPFIAIDLWFGYIGVEPYYYKWKLTLAFGWHSPILEGEMHYPHYWEIGKREPLEAKTRRLDRNLS